jgi:hypothetical protein
MLQTQLKTFHWAYLSIHRGGSHYPVSPLLFLLRLSPLPPLSGRRPLAFNQRGSNILRQNPTLRLCSVDFLRFPWCYGPLIRGSPDLGRRRSDLPPAATWRVGDGRRERADRGQVSAIRRHRHRPQQVRALNHRIGAQGVHPRSVAAR